MDDVRRVFQKLVQALADQQPSYLSQPFPLTELHETILPYRRYRRDLHFEAIEDYEMAVLRLLAGEGGYVTVEPREVRDFLVREQRAVNPRTGVFRTVKKATVTLNRDAARAMLDAGRAYAPPGPDYDEPAFGREQEEARSPLDSELLDQPDQPISVQASAQVEPPLREERAETMVPVDPGDESTPGPTTPSSSDDQIPLTLLVPRCFQCDSFLPVWRMVSYCPSCGTLLRHTTCRRCGERLDEGWRHCGACGEPIAE